MADHPIQGLMKTAMENLKEMIDVNTIIGDPVETPDGSVILTVSKVGFGFAAGGSEFSGNQMSESKGNDGERKEAKLPFGGGSGGGVSITPIAFLIVGSSGVKILHLDENTHVVDKILESAPQTIEKIQHMFKKDDKPKQKMNHQNNISY
ncbi:sporulation protein YtfJ [Bacillus sp. WMMC1349]|uniref:GerW family sporulation protein n=1 Tax=Bacillus sp. WMMC1349 TaxID=2736254 RepID=UPI001553259D|nr:GerW family sporulation protein [Bacillus sp. WMMC1349]NPC93732.1 sporulation protein YtfJ [Bacillus sp. WMMC1349]